MVKARKRRPKLTQPLKWHGGKHYQTKDIIDLMPSHTHYVEPFFGGGSVLLDMVPSEVSEVVNDIHLGLTNFWRVLQESVSFAKFMRIVESVPFSQVEWQEAAARQHRIKVPNVRAAVAFFIRCRQSRAGRFDCFATLSRRRIRRGMNEQASAWMTAVEGLPAVAERLKRVVILCDDAKNVIRSQDGSETLFYLDPPYLHETRVSTNDYFHEMTRKQHAGLLALIKKCKGKVMLSGYPNDLYDRKLRDWHRKEFRIDNKASSAKSKRIMTEVIWMNFQPSRQRTNGPYS